MSTITETPLGAVGVGGGTLARAWDPYAFDTFPTGGGISKRGKMLVHGTFQDRSTDGYADHLHYTNAASVIGTTAKYALRGNGALIQGPSDQPIAQAQAFQSAGSFKRGGWTEAPGLVSYSAWIAVRGDGSMTENLYPFGDIFLGFDGQLPEANTMAPGDPGRAFGRLILRVRGDGTLAWYLYGGKTSTASGASTRSDVLIPGSEGLFTGLNEGKVNYYYVRLTVDFGALSRGSGFYVQAQIANRVFDLRNVMTAVPYDLLLTNGSLDRFTGGFNVGQAITRSTANPTLTNVQLLVGETFASEVDKP